MRRTIAFTTSLILVVAALLGAYHAAAIGHVRDRHGHVVHVAQSDGPAPSQSAGYHDARGLSVDPDDCAVVGVHQAPPTDAAAVTTPLESEAERPAIAPRSLIRTIPIYRHAPKTSPPIAS